MNTELLISIFALIVALAIAILRLRKAEAERKSLLAEQDRLMERFRGVTDADAEKARVLESLESERTAARAQMEKDRIEAVEALSSLQRKIQEGGLELTSLQTRIQALRTEFERLDEEANLQSFGVYKPHYEFADSEKYQAELDRIYEAQKRMVKDKAAATCAIEWTVNGSKVEGRKSTNQTLKLMLRAFNGECDAAIAKVKYNNVQVMEARIRKAHELINGLANVQRCEISVQYLRLKLAELFLVHEYQEKVQEEKEEQRRIREQMREEEIAQRELEKARQEAEKEEQRYAQALAKAREEAERAVGARQVQLLAQIGELQRRLQEAQTNKERAIARAQMTRSGHVYVISNIGSFGENVYKIGMTRRLDPLDRIRELSDASVPFQFDVHAVIFSEDAPTLENKLHREFHRRRVNRINERKEFFRVSIDDISASVLQNHGQIEVTKIAEAKDYRKTLSIIEEESRLGTAAVTPVSSDFHSPIGVQPSTDLIAAIGAE
ncbi:MAG TPA: DUF4041 domain-containing protein [Thermoanaerobaculia bacterium]|nr:DUF4041 domain-containing protein [Thermoanaerobaculia bacterium]